MARVVIGLSGGVDSSVAAYLLQQAGHEVIGLFMINWHDTTGTLEGDCPWHDDRLFAELVARRLDIPFHTVDLSDQYRRRVVDYMFSEYAKGRTPNPDVLCNREIKFDVFLKEALKLGADFVATGHYCRKAEETAPDGRTIYKLLAGSDPNKDQSYFLHRLNQAQLSKTLFPLAGVYKRDVRKMAEDAGLHVAVKKDSTGICFIGERPFKEFLMRYLPPKKGEIRCLDDDRVMGEHDGLTYHTLGQRKGLQIGGVKGGKGADTGEHEAWFVAGKDMVRNILYVVQGHDHPALLFDELTADQLSWIAGSLPDDRPPTHWVYGAKTRYRQTDAPCEIDGFEADFCRIRFAAPQWAVTPGQSVVVYESRVCLGGGVIV